MTQHIKVHFTKQVVSRHLLETCLSTFSLKYYMEGILRKSKFSADVIMTNKDKCAICAWFSTVCKSLKQEELMFT